MQKCVEYECRMMTIMTLDGIWSNLGLHSQKANKTIHYKSREILLLEYFWLSEMSQE